MHRRNMMLSLASAFATPGVLAAQAIDETALDDVAREQLVLNGFSTSTEIIEMVLGFDEAPVTLELYASFTCPHCANFHNDVLAQLRRDYVATGRVRVIYRDVFLDRPGLWASMMARCAGPDRFYDAADLLYHNQSVWSRGETPQILGFLAEIGSRVGMSDADLEACYTNAAMAENLVAWSDEHRREDNITSTPTLIIDGDMYPNMAYDDLKDAVDRALAKR